MNCPKCQAHMALGFIADVGRGEIGLPVWYSGEFKRTFWGGLGLGKRKSFYVQTSAAPVAATSSSTRSSEMSHG